MICCGMAVKRMGMLDVSVRKMMALTVKMESVTLIGKDNRILHALYINCVKLIVKYCFFVDVLFLGGHLKFG